MSITETRTERADAAEQPAPLLQLDDLVVEYRGSGRRAGHRAVDGVSLSVAPGEFVALVGESGSGKSTLVQGALGLLPAAARIERGAIAYSGVDVTRWSEGRLSRIRGSYVGFIPQDPGTSLNPTKRIGRQVIEAVRFTERSRRSAAEHREAAHVALREAGLENTERLFEQFPHELSGGMKQRVLIAIALAGQPRIIIADEPTSALDVTVQRRILDHLQGLRERLGIGVLLVTHDLGVALDRADRVLVMQQGELVEQGSVDAVLRDPRHEYTRRLLEAAPASHAGRLEPVGPRLPVDGVALRADALSKRYALRGGGEVVALDGAGLELRAGTTHAIVGESGAGKSTLAAILAGFGTPDTGSVHVGGRETTHLRRGALRELRRELQFVFQNPYASLDPRWTVERIVAEPLRAFGLVQGRAAQRERVLELLDAVALDAAHLRRTPAELSGGQRQRVAIARALALRPKVLVLDEAVSALDVSVQAQILKLLVDLQAELGLSYVFVTHDLGVVRLIADDVTVMRGGRIAESGPAEQVLEAPRDAYTRVLLDAVPGTRLASAKEARA